MGASSYAPRRRLSARCSARPAALTWLTEMNAISFSTTESYKELRLRFIGRARTPASPRPGDQLCNIHSGAELLRLDIRVKALSLNFDLIRPPLRRCAVTESP